MSSIGRMVLAEREGRRLTAYRDSVGVWTIGIGHTSAAGAPKVTPGLKITAAECDAIFARDLVQYEQAVVGATQGPHALKQHEFDALVSLCFNIGTGAFRRSTVARKLREGDKAGAAAAILMWNKPAEILGRRRGEHAQFLGHRPVARLDKAVSGSPVAQAPAQPNPKPTPPRQPARPTLPAPPSPAPRPTGLAALLAWLLGRPA